MCHASWPMARTSWVWLLRAMTVGSLRTIPRPLAYTSVFAVPKSMARSLARPPLPATRPSLRPAAVAPTVPLGIRCQRLQLAGEPLHVRLHRPRLPVPQPQDQRAEERQHDGDTEIHEVGHDEATSSTGWLHSAQSLPPSQVSRFQMGTVALRVSMQKRAASNASARWGAEAATNTDVSPTTSAPTRCRTATRPS